MKTSITEKIASAALKNKSVQNAVKKSVMESIVGKDQAAAQEEQRSRDASVIEGLVYSIVLFDNLCEICEQLH